MVRILGDLPKRGVIPLGRTRPLNQRKYEISKHRYYELYHFCMQYNEWKEELEALTSTVKSPIVRNGGMTQGNSDQTARLAEKRVTLEEKCKLIEQTAVETDAALHPYILLGVTNEWATYKHLRMVNQMPCGKDYYYQCRRRFYHLLSKKYDDI